MADIAGKIQRGELAVESLKAYRSWLHAEDVFDEATYNDFLPQVETSGSKGSEDQSTRACAERQHICTKIVE